MYRDEPRASSVFEVAEDAKGESLSADTASYFRELTQLLGENAKES
jgi:hypothetical protein